MKTGWTVIAVLVLGTWLTLYLVNARSERRKAVADARREFSSAVYTGSGVRGAQRAYVEACRACASANECERDRLVIAAGRSSETYNPCER